jgi:hypothetical protein
VRRILRAIVVLGLLADPAAASAIPPCRVEARVEPTAAYLGQQVVYRLTILRRGDVAAVRWIEPLSFPSFRVEWLPGRAPDPAISGIGDHYLVFEERRALFPALEGDLVVPAARLLCRVESSGVARDVEVPVPAVGIRVLPLPEAGRPEGFDGLVGPVDLHSTISPSELALGGSVVLSVTLRGRGNVWVARPPLDPEAQLEDVDAFARRPGLVWDRGRELVAQRSFGFDLVPRRTGRLEIPALRVPYFDPATGEYAMAETPALRVEVGPRTPPVSHPAVPVPTRPARSPPRGGALRWAFWAAGGLALAVGLWVALRRRRAGQRLAGAELALREAERAWRAGDRAGAWRAWSRALREVLETTVPGLDGLGAGEIASRAEGAGREAAELLDALERARFAEPSGGRGPDADPARVRALVGVLARSRPTDPG